MALARARRERTVEYWPGFVDALSTLVLGIVFLLSTFVVVQFYLSQEVTGKDVALARLNAQIAELTELLSMEKTGKATLEETLSTLRASLAAAEGERDRFKGLYEGIGSGAADAQGKVTALTGHIVLVGHGLQKAFGWWDGPGFGGFEKSLTDMGFQHANILTYVATGGQLAAGVLLILGLFTPLAAAAALAYLVNGVLAEAVAAHEQARLSSFLTDGHEYKIMLVCTVAAIILIGPGRYGFDAGRGWARRPFVGSFVALLVGIGAGIAAWVLLNGANPLA